MLPRLLSPKVEVSYAMLRVAGGILFAFHGAQKLFGLLATHPSPPVGSQLWFGGIIELTTGILMAIGAFTPWAAFLASGMMAVAYVQFHWKLQFDASFFPIANKGEPALLNAFLFLFFACRGGGRFSVDELMRRRRPART